MSRHDGAIPASPAAFFPRGLYQPPGSFRFSLDALLLAASVPPGAYASLLELGSGCGAAALGALLRSPGMSGLGLDAQAELVAAARLNANRLDLAERFTSATADFRAAPDPALLPPASSDCCIMNPPYGILGHGRPPASESRKRALFGEPGTIERFLLWAYAGLSETGVLHMIFPAEKSAGIFPALAKSGFFLFRKTALHGRAAQPWRVLLESAKKEPGTPPEEKSLFLFQGAEKDAPYTAEALSFCPWLHATPGRVP